jgi:hypothetical protein
LACLNPFRDAENRDRSGFDFIPTEPGRQRIQPMAFGARDVDRISASRVLWRCPTDRDSIAENAPSHPIIAEGITTMRRKTSLNAESLEGRTLLSSLSFSLTTGQSVYQVGQPIQITFSETNTGKTPVTVEVSPTDFDVSQNGELVWQSDPGNALKPPTARTLLAGQSVQQTTTWDGTTPDPFGLSAGSAPSQINNFGAFTVSNPNGPQGLSAAFQITNPITTSLTTSKPVYQFGEPVKVTFTEVNTASVPVTIYPSPPEAANIYHNGTALWVLAYPQVVSLNPTVLSARQTITAPYTFNVGSLTGAFEAAFGPQNDPTEYTASFQVEAPAPEPLATSITTDQSTYAPGEPVKMTFTATNNGAQPIAVLTGPASFQISENGTAIWNATSNLSYSETSWTTLAPGQSYSQTASWNGLPNTGTLSSLPGVFTVSNFLDQANDTTSFQIVGTVSVPPFIPAPPPSTSPVTAKLVTNQPAYKPGQSVELSMVLTNVSTAKVRLARDAQTSGITVMDGSTVVFHSSRIRAALAAQIIKPHHSIKLALAWSGRPNQSGITRLAAGTYTVQVVEGGYSGTATVRLVR